MRSKSMLPSSTFQILIADRAKNRAEFFAVATEVFFERPRELRTNEPELYALLTDFFKLDPASLAGPPQPAEPDPPMSHTGGAE